MSVDCMFDQVDEMIHLGERAQWRHGRHLSRSRPHIRLERMSVVVSRPVHLDCKSICCGRESVMVIEISRRRAKARSRENLHHVRDVLRRDEHVDVADGNCGTDARHRADSTLEYDHRPAHAPGDRRELASFDLRAEKCLRFCRGHFPESREPDVTRDESGVRLRDAIEQNCRTTLETQEKSPRFSGDSFDACRVDVFRCG